MYLHILPTHETSTLHDGIMHRILFLVIMITIMKIVNLITVHYSTAFIARVCWLS